MPAFDELRDVGGDALMRHAAHRQRDGFGEASFGEHQLQFACA